MSKIEKLISRLKSLPKDFTWDELTKVLEYYGFQELPNGKTGGSRRKFSNGEKRVICLHKPHPGNIVKVYALKQVMDYLKI